MATEGDNISLELLRSQLAKANAANTAQEPPLKGGGGDGTFDGMEARVKRLEDDGKELRADLKAIMRDLGDIKAKLSGIDGRINAMPTTWQMVGLVVALAIAMFTVIRVALPL